MLMSRKSVATWAGAAVFGALVVLNPIQGHARIFQFRPLEDPIVERLPAESKAAYLESIDAIDHINYVAAFERINDAVKAAPDSVELRFFAVRLGRYLGEISTGIDSARYFDNAIEHSQAILESQSLTQRDRGRAEYLLNWLTTQRNTIEQRDEGRRSYGMQIAKAYAKEIYRSDEDSEEIRKFREAISELTKPGSASARATAAAAAALSKAVGQVKGAAAGALAPADGAAPAAGEPSAAAPPEGGAVEISGLNGAPGAAADMADLPAPKMVGHSQFIKDAIPGNRAAVAPGDDKAKSAQAFVESFIKDSLAKWDFEAVKASFDPELLTALTTTPENMMQVQLLFGTMPGMLGDFKEIRGMNGETAIIAAQGGVVVSGEYTATISFTNDEFDIFIEVVKRGDADWKVRDMNIDPEKVKAMAAQFGQAFGGGKAGGPAPAAAPAAAPAVPAEPAPVPDESAAPAPPAEPAPAGAAPDNPFGSN